MGCIHDTFFHRVCLMKTVFHFSYYHYFKFTADAVPTVAAFDTPLDWHVFRGAFIYAAILHAMRKMKNTPAGDARSNDYEQLATAFSGMLHRKGDMVDDPDGEGQRERQFDWRDADAHATFIAELAQWAQTGEAKYRVAAWAAQWEPMNLALRRLEAVDVNSEILSVFRAAFSMEWLSTDEQLMNASGSVEELLHLCRCAQNEFMDDTALHFMVRPIAALEAFLEKEADAELFQPRFFLKNL